VLAWLSVCRECRLAQMMPLKFNVSCISKIQTGFTFLVPAHLGSPGQRAVKRVCVCVAGCYVNDKDGFATHIANKQPDWWPGTDSVQVHSPVCCFRPWLDVHAVSSSFPTSCPRRRGCLARPTDRRRSRPTRSRHCHHPDAANRTQHTHTHTHTHRELCQLLTKHTMNCITY